MKINNDDIISAAKTLRARQESRLTTPENPLKTKRSRTPWIAAAACAAAVWASSAFILASRSASCWLYDASFPFSEEILLFLAGICGIVGKTLGAASRLPSGYGIVLTTGFFPASTTVFSSTLSCDGNGL
jgi:hypothetical protein